MEIDSGQQRMVIRAEDAGAAVPRVLVEPVHAGLRDSTTAIAHEKVVQYQPWQGVKGVPPAGKGRRHPEGEARLAQQPPGALVPAPTQVEVGTQDDGVVLDRSHEMLSLERASGGPEPSVAGGAARIEMSIYQPESGVVESYGRGDRYPALQYQRKLDRLRALEWEGREDRISPIAPIGAVPHRRSVAEVHDQLTRRLHHIFLRPQLGDQDPSRLPFLKQGDRRVASIGFLGEHHERHIGIGAEVDVVSIPNPGYDLAQAAPADPDIPAQHHQAARAGSVVSGSRDREIESNLGADIAAPRVQAEPLVVLVAGEAKISGVGQWEYDGSRGRLNGRQVWACTSGYVKVKLEKYGVPLM